VSKKPTRFVPPTLEEVKAYCEERNNGVDPEKWYAFYASKGWLIGKTPMKNWKMAVITWEKNGYGQKGSQQGGNPFTRLLEEMEDEE
jgi:hypothetical protein